MPGFIETATTVREHTEPVPDTRAAESPDLNGGVSPEMPASHVAYNIDPTTISVDGLVRTCSHYIKVAELNPELAEAQAVEALQNIQRKEELREEGKDEETVAKEQWSAMRERRKQKSKVKSEQESKSKDTERSEQHTGKVLETNKPEPSDAEPVEQTAAVVGTDEIIRSAESHETFTRASVEQKADITAQLDTQSAYAETAKAMSPSDHSDSDPDTRSAPRATPHAREQYVEQPMTAELVVDEMVAAEYDPPQETDETQEVVTEERVTSMIGESSMVEALPGLKVDELEVVHVLETKPAKAESAESITGADEFEKEPVEFVDDFTEALQSLLDVIDEEGESPVALEDGFDESIRDTTASFEDVEPVPPIALEVAGTLRELSDEEKETITPTLQEIIEKIQTLDPLEADDATPEAIETTKQELRELVITLFDQLDIKYELEDVDHFIATLLRLDLEPLQEELPEELEDQTVLEDEGTHEIKTQRQSFATLVANVERTAGRLIGKTALLMDSRHRVFEINAQ